MDSTSSDLFSNSFAASTKEDWQKAARLELEGADPFEKLSFEKRKLSILPYYDQRNTDTFQSFHLTASVSEFLGARAWHNMPSITVEKESEANHRALSDLNSGADGIIFHLKKRDTNFSALLDKIEWPHCALSFQGNISLSSLEELHTHVLKKNYVVKTLVGTVFPDAAMNQPVEILNLFEPWANFHPIGINVTVKESAAEEIANALVEAVKQIDLLTDHGFSIRHALRALAFNVTIDEDFFLSIAKLKALRLVWNNVVVSFDANISSPAFIHASSPAWNKKDYQPNGNMLKSTTAGLAAVLGGCDALTVFPEAEDNTMMNRIARNVSSVLREESHLSKVADPTAGSYYIDSLVNQLAENVWKEFQKLVG